MHSRSPRMKLTVTVFAVALASGGAWWFLRHPASRTGPVSLPAAGGYVDPTVCADCHSDIAATYQKTGMGRSFRKIQTEKDLGAPPTSKPFYHAASKSFFSMRFQDGAWVQRRWQTGFDGKETNVDEKRVDYVLGSG